MNKKITTIIMPVLWLAIIWTVSSLPAKKLPSTRIIGLDKLAHIAEYLVLALLVNRGAKSLSLPKRAVMIVYLILFASAGLDEWHQNYIPQRSVNIWDFLANSLGLGIGFITFLVRHDRSKKPVA